VLDSHDPILYDYHADGVPVLTVCSDSSLSIQIQVFQTFIYPKRPISCSMASSDEEFCPRCGTAMSPSRESLRVRGIYVGIFDSMTCPICRYYYFTDKEYDTALETARSMGIVGPEIPLVHPKIPLKPHRFAIPTAQQIDNELAEASFNSPQIPVLVSKEFEGRDTNTVSKKPELNLRLVTLAPVSAGEQ
jgi:hypothetical protein